MGNSAPLDATLFGIRGRLIDDMLRFTSVLAIPGLATSLLRIPQTGWKNSMFGHIAVALLVWCLFFFRGKLNFWVRGSALLFMFLTLGISGFLTYGLSSTGRDYIIIFIILATLFFGLRAGFASLAVSMLFLIGLSIAVTRHWVTFTTVDFNVYNIASSSWINLIVGWSLFVGSVVIVADRLYSALIDALRVSQRQTDEIRQRAADLDEQISERMQTEEKLQQATAFQRTILDSANYSIISTSLDGILLTFNKAAERWLGYKAHEVIDKVTPCILHDSAEVELRAQELSQELGATIEPGFEVFVAKARLGIAEEREWTYVRKDGSRFPVLLSVTTLRNAEGNIIGFVGIGSDITERKQAEQEIIKLNEELEQRVKDRTAELIEAKEHAEVANKTKSAFLANMSHELRTPLNGILGYAQILKRGGALNRLQEDGLSVIEKSGNYLLTLINDILDISRIEANRMELHSTDFTLSAFLQGIVGIISVRAEEKGLDFYYEPVLPLPLAIKADETRLRQVLLNLLGNAVKFTEQGAVTFKVAAFIEQQTADTGQEETATLRFEVTDTGQGIAPDQLERIFLPFDQISTNKYRTGTGLGLAISQALAEAMGGVIQVRSIPGEGSTFIFEVTLPVVLGDVQEESGWEETVIGYTGERRKILVVDDRYYNRMVLIDLLKPLGFDLLEAGNGKEALEKTVAMHPEMILMDLRMPVMSGNEAALEIRKNPDLQDIIIVAVSASVFNQDQQESLLAGCNYFLRKPVSMKELLTILGKTLHIEWIYRESRQDIASEPLEVPLVIPSLGEMNVLHELAVMGNVRKIKIWATELGGKDKKYLPFTNQLARLASDFKTKAILELVENHIGEG